MSGTGWSQSSPSRRRSTRPRWTDKTLAEIGIDSVGLVEAIFALEESFDVQVPFNANDPSESDFDISSVASIVRAVEALVAAKH